MKIENLMNRKMYKEIKKYDRREMEQFLVTMYSNGFEDGVNANAKVDYEIDLIEKLRSKKGIGGKTLQKILEAIREE